MVRGVRWALGVRPVYKTVDTCAAEFAARTPYHYSSYDEETEVEPRTRPAVLILGSGPNRIGQGIEFDYSCVHAAMASPGRRHPAGPPSGVGYETIMVNCNPETVSTDYDTADRLYFEPLTLEDVLEVVARRAAGRPDRRRDRPARRADPAAAGPGPQGRRRADRRHQPGGHPPGRGAGRVRPGAGRGEPAGPQARPGPLLRRGPADRRRDRLPGAGPALATCWAGAGWRSSTTRAPWPPTSSGPPRSPRSTRCWSTSSSTTRWRSTSTRSTTAASSTSAG